MTQFERQMLRYCEQNGLKMKMHRMERQFEWAAITCSDYQQFLAVLRNLQGRGYYCNYWYTTVGKFSCEIRVLPQVLPEQESEKEKREE